jgi:hypothetical protein
MENQSGNQQQPNQQQEQEKIVSLNEDSKSHEHDDASYQKLMQAKENEKSSGK